MKIFRSSPKEQQGFTIVELMIATLIFSVILLIVTMGILQITRVYFKGVTEANTQNTARSVIDTVSQAIQFSGGPVTPTAGSGTPSSPKAFCVGDQRFSYDTGWQLEDGSPDNTKHQAFHTLVMDTFANCNQSTPQGLGQQAVSGRELLSPHMRLANIQVSNVGTNLYRVTVRVVYGDDDLLTNPTGTDASCKGISAGTQFCSVSELSTVVVKRVQ
jgi:prepilin-type N-terminal cleavage/methylation domain-containing protein